MEETKTLVDSAGRTTVTREKRWLAPLVFLIVVTVVFATCTAPWWRDGQLLAGDHSDGPIRFACELARMSPEMFPRDVAVQSSENVGTYEYFLRGMVALARSTGWSLLTTNLIVCWAGNFLYLAGVMLLLWRLNLSAWVCGLGTLLAAQPFGLISMGSGLMHSLAIPREVWLWPLPWLIMWFALGRREGWHLVCFYIVLGATYCVTYPLWAALFGLAFGLADGWRFLKEKRLAGLGWLALGGLLCVVIVALPALGIARTVAGGESALLDYNQITRSVYFTKGFRRLILFSAVALFAFWAFDKRAAKMAEPRRRLQVLLTVSLGVCVIYEPFQRLIPTLSLLYLGRLSLIVYLVSMVAVVLWLHESWREWRPWGRRLAVAGLLLLVLDPVKRAVKDRRAPSPPGQIEFVNLCRVAKSEVPIDGLCVVPPEPGCHYFRAYAERGLWINRKDVGVLSRTRDLYTEAKHRVQIFEAFYAEDTTPTGREAILNQMRTNGVTHVVTKSDVPWVALLSWPVVQRQGVWELRAAPPAP